SHAIATAWPRLPSSPAVCSAIARSRSHSATAAPDSSKRATMARPMPWAPPVTTAFLPLRSILLDIVAAIVALQTIGAARRWRGACLQNRLAGNCDSVCMHDDAERASLRRSLQGLAQDRLPVVRRSGRPDRADAPHTGRREEMDRRAALPACAELLHAAAGAGGDPARNVCRLAAARRARRADRWNPVRAAWRAGDAGAQPALRARPRRTRD